MKETIYDFYGRIIGSILTKPNGDKVAYDFYGRILGTYIKQYNTTYDFYGKILAKGDITASLVWGSVKK